MLRVPKITVKSRYCSTAQHVLTATNSRYTSGSVVCLGVWGFFHTVNFNLPLLLNKIAGGFAFERIS